MSFKFGNGIFIHFEMPRSSLIGPLANSNFIAILSICFRSPWIILTIFLKNIIMCTFNKKGSVGSLQLSNRELFSRWYIVQRHGDWCLRTEDAYFREQINYGTGNDSSLNIKDGQDGQSLILFPLEILVTVSRRAPAFKEAWMRVISTLS